MVSERYKQHPCTSYLGDFTETIFSRLYPNTIRMERKNPGYDFICNDTGKTVDVKASSTLTMYSRTNKKHWLFNINKNKKADYFSLFAVDSRIETNILHMWIIPGNLINMRSAIGISVTNDGISRFKKYEKPIDAIVMERNFLKVQQPFAFVY